MIIRLLSWNVNGIRAVYRKGFIEWLLKEQPDVLCLQEIKAKVEQLPQALQHIAGYRAYFFPAERKGYSGVAVYTKLKPLGVRRGFGIERFDSEGRCMMLDFGDFLLFNVYFPNGKMSAERLSYKLDFYEAFLRHIEALRKEGHNIVFCGDVNTAHKEIDLARPKENSGSSGFLPIERAWLDRVIAAGYVDTFRMFESGAGHYTYWDLITRARARNVGWRIDYFFVNIEFKARVKRGFIMQHVMGSDHCPVGIEIETRAD